MLRLICAVLSLGMVLGCLGCGSDVDTDFSQLQQAINFGQEDLDNLYPNVGAFIVHDPDWAHLPNGGYYPICSGTLIHPRIFLTASHCTYGMDEALAAGDYTGVYVTFDQDTQDPGVNLLEVTEMITHPDYANFIGINDAYDVAALVLAEPVTGIQPASMPQAGYLDQLRKDGKLRRNPPATKLPVAGYGMSLSWPPPSLEYTEARFFAESSYQTLRKAWLVISQNPATGNGGTCFGDSGGPIFYEDEELGRVLVGVTSWGDAQTIAIGFYFPLVGLV